LEYNCGRKRKTAIDEIMSAIAEFQIPAEEELFIFNSERSLAEIERKKKSRLKKSGSIPGIRRFLLPVPVRTGPVGYLRRAW
jgi:hypothetical protein